MGYKLSFTEALSLLNKPPKPTRPCKICGAQIRKGRTIPDGQYDLAERHLFSHIENAVEIIIDDLGVLTDDEIQILVSSINRRKSETRKDSSSKKHKDRYIRPVKFIEKKGVRND